jgi:enoyl reductase-like protein
MACVVAGAGFATEESMTTILPGPPFLTGNWVVGDFSLPVMPLEGSGGRELVRDLEGGLSAIFLSS